MKFLARLVFGLCWLGAWPVLGQQALNGYVVDAASGEPLIGAAVTAFQPAAKAPYRGCLTNQFGYFTLDLPAGTYTVRVNFMGYHSHSTTLSLPANSQPLRIALVAEVRQLSEVVVADEQPDVFRQVGFHTLTAAQLKQVPTLLGEADPVKVLQLLPGMKSGREGGSDLHVRGGGPGQNLILLDDIPVYNINHLFGFFSVFNTAAVKQVQAYKGGFPARYGGRISSVVDVRIREGNLKKFWAEGSIGLLSSTLLAEGPLLRDKSSVLVAGRYTYPTQMLQLAQQIAGTSDQLRLGFYDLNGKWNHLFSDRDRLSLSLYASRDAFLYTSRTPARLPFRTGQFTYEDSFVNRWGNLTASSRWFHLLSEKVTSAVTAYFTNFQLEIEGGVSDPANGFDYTAFQRFSAGIRDWGIKSDVDWTPSARHRFRFGTQAVFHRFTVGRIQLSRQWLYLNGSQIRLDTTFSARPIPSADLDFYAEHQWFPQTGTEVNTGLRQSFVWVQGRLFSLLQPRLAGVRQLSRNWQAQASYTRMVQPLHLLSNSGAGMPTDIWIPATGGLPPEKGFQLAAGVAKIWPGKHQIELRTEAYYKKMANLIEFAEGVDVLSRGPETNFFREETYATWQDRVSRGTGLSYGLETMLHKKTGRWTGWLAHTLSWTNRRFDDLNQGKPFPYRYDRRHEVSLVSAYAFRSNRRFSAVWTFATPNAYTLPASHYLPYRFEQSGQAGTTSPLFPLDDISARNNFRPRSYHRLDVSFTFSRQRKWYERSWVLGVYNVYNRANAFSITTTSQNTITARNATVPDRQLAINSIFSILPSLSYQVRF